MNRFASLQYQSPLATYHIARRQPEVAAYPKSDLWFVSHKVVQAQTMLIFGNSDILDLAQKHQVSISVATEVFVRCLFSMGQGILSPIY